MSQQDNGKKSFQSGVAVKVFFFSMVGLTLLVLVGGGAVIWRFSQSLPQIISVADYRPLTVTRILGTHGKDTVEIGEFFKERRYIIPYDKIPDILVKAFISAEDDRFFEHPGINVFSIVRAGIANFKAGHVVQGGSTITQQVAKSLLLTPERSFDRKIKEVILASRIERNLTKQQILYLYLNQIYLGHGAYGVQAASRTYFNKDVSDLNVAEAALLAGMPQAPGKYSPLLNPKKAKERQVYVLRRLFENKYITQVQMDEGMNQPLKVFHDEDLNSKFAPYFVEYLRKYLIEKYGEKAVYEGGLTLNVPLDPELAKTASRSIKDGLLAVDKRIGFRGPIQHLNNSEEIEKFLKDSRAKLIERRLHFQLFMPDGRLDSTEAVKFAGLKAEAELLETGEMYQAVVTGFDNPKKIAKVMVGAIPAELHLDKMKWARPLRDDNNPQQARPEPTLPSRLFKVGDVIWVAPVAKVAGAKEVLGAHLQVALEQEPVIQGALFSMDARTGQVLAMVGGYDFAKSEFNRAVQALRQPGSAFKPVIYSAGLEKGFTPTSIIVDSPLVFRDTDGTGAWKPNNYEEKFYGDTTFRQALIKSRNIPTVKIVQAIQVPFLIQYAKRLGMNGQFNTDLSIALGSASISLFDLTRVFALYPRLGRQVTPIFYNKLVDRDGMVMEEQLPKPLPVIPQISTDFGNQADPAAAPVQGETAAVAKVGEIKLPIYPPANDPDQVLDPRVAYVMTNLMKEVVNSGTGHGAKDLGKNTAGKTGTTNDSIDAWFLGYTPDVVTGVWVGFDNQKSIGRGETGAKVALPIWLNYMKAAVKNYAESDFNVPPGVAFASIDPYTGKLASANSSNAIREAFIEGTQPTEVGEGEAATATDTQVDFFKEDRD